MQARAGSTRVFLLYITRNDHVHDERKLTVRAKDMDELIVRIREEMDLSEAWQFVVCKAAGSSIGGNPDPSPYCSFEDVPTRAVVQLWPAMMFPGEDDGEGDVVAVGKMHSELYRAAVRGDERSVARLLGALPRPPCALRLSTTLTMGPGRERSVTADSLGEEVLAGDDDGEAASSAADGGGGGLGESAALHAAAYYGSIDCLQHFIDAWGEAAWTLASEHGQVALHCAARGGHAEAVRLLLDAGADACAVDDESRTARDIAIRDGHTVRRHTRSAHLPPSILPRLTDLCASTRAHVRV
jgi:hypothetical protein